MTSSPSRINWSQLGLELVIVVGGILIALGVDSWWGALSDAQLERAYLVQMVADLGEAELALADMIPETEQAAQAVLNLLAVRRGQRPIEHDSIAAWIRRAGWWGNPFAPLSTAQALAASENLFVVRSPTVRSSIIQLLDRLRYLEARVQPMEDRVFDNYTLVNRTVDPIARGQAMYVGVAEGDFETLTESRPLRGSPEDLWRPLFDHADFQANFIDLFWTHELLRWLQQSMLEAIRGLREQVEAELEAESP